MTTHVIMCAVNVFVYTYFVLGVIRDIKQRFHK
jgi:hypothetical protein